MAFNGSGTFARVHDWTTDLGNSVPVTASRMDDEMDGMATGLSTALLKDGQQVATARIPFAQGVGVADGSVSAPAVNFTSDTNSGIYRIGADNIGISVNGTKIVDIATTGAAITGTLSATSTVTSTGNFTVGSSTFTVVAASGNTTVGGTLTHTGVADFADGTNSLPSITNTGDLNTGIYFSAADEVAITAGGTQRARFTSAGAIVTGAITASTSIASTTTLTAGNGFTVTTGTVTLPADSVAAAALAAPAGWVVIQTQAASSNATLDFETGLGDTLYDAFCLVISNATPETDDQEMWLRVGTGGPVTYQAGVADYGWFMSGSATLEQDSADAQIQLSFAGLAGGSVGNASGESYSATLYFNNPEASNFFHVHGTCVYSRADGGVEGGAFGGQYLTAAAVTGLRFLFSSGDIGTGRFTLYGMTKTA